MVTLSTGASSAFFFKGPSDLEGKLLEGLASGGQGGEAAAAVDAAPRQPEPIRAACLQGQTHFRSRELTPFLLGSSVPSKPSERELAHATF